jgi:hypothetical protein
VQARVSVAEFPATRLVAPGPGGVWVEGQRDFKRYYGFVKTPDAI